MDMLLRFVLLREEETLYQINQITSIVCLDSLTLTRPGTGYTSIPTVYINGDSSLVTARINASGFVIGFDVLDRTQIFDTAPTVEIVGGGLGAKALASIMSR